MERHPGDPPSTTADHLETMRREFDAQAERFEEARARLQATFDQVQKGRPQQEVIHDSAVARLQDRLDTMPVIEQAKGILMAQRQCGPDEAFDLLRRASQRAGVTVSARAAQIVEQAAARKTRRSSATNRSAGGRPTNVA